MRHTLYAIFLLFAVTAVSSSNAGAADLLLPGEGACHKVTGQLDGAYHQYFALPAWNANGSKLLVVR